MDLCFLGTGDPGVRKRPPKNTKEVSSKNGISERKIRWGRQLKTQIMKEKTNGRQLYSKQPT